jgi:RNA polymerase sigma factor (sigma-70 family)
MKSMSDTSGDAQSPATKPDALAILWDNHRSFLRYLERRVGDRAIAEDILQDAFVRSLGKLDELPDEAIVPWFYRTLRNAAIDHFRRQSTASQAFETFAKELQATDVPPADLHAEICACVGQLAETLKPEYADALRAIELEGTPVKAFAEQRGLSASNAGVRVFRAREALRRRVTESCGVCAEHGCLDCSCRSGAKQGEV